MIGATLNRSCEADAPREVERCCETDRVANT